MNTMELQERVSKLTTTRIVTEQKGSWQWQDAYRKAWYRARLADNGKVVWSAYSHTRKLSSPQLSRLGVKAEGWYSAHNRQISRKEAIKGLGISLVRSIESRGCSFA